MNGLAGKRALVTGASRGIGREVALRLAAEGVAVALNYHTGEAEAREAADEIRAAGGAAEVVAGSVASAAEAEGLVAQASKLLGGLDILVNNAGITRDNLVMRLSEEDWDAVLDTNLKGAFLCTKAAIRGMIRQRSGRIVNMSSVVALTGNPGQANYTAAKAGLIGFTKTVAREVASRGVTVNAVAPGFISTRDGGRGPRGDTEADHGAHPAGPVRLGGGRSGVCCVPRQRRRRLHHRTGPQCRRGVGHLAARLIASREPLNNSLSAEWCWWGALQRFAALCWCRERGCWGVFYRPCWGGFPAPNPDLNPLRLRHAAKHRWALIRFASPSSTISRCVFLASPR